MTRENTTGFVRGASGTLTAVTSGGASQYRLTDVQGSVIGLPDASGKRTAAYSHGPYGEARTTSGTSQPYRYTGTYLGPSGLYEMGARYYDPQLGCFPAGPIGQGEQPPRLRGRRPRQPQRSERDRRGVLWRRPGGTLRCRRRTRGNRNG
ncbi:hypothetical protein GTU99_00205 [Streptomyces sp. PRKS01-65]|nr:RHS repeat-associated core domain-containing protein [Streptomyces harenosi]NEY30642.1 hypothetical protein [Streptomyces harenosi]